MRKDTYLTYLRDILDTLEISESEKQTIIEDYDSMIEDALQEGKKEEDIERIFGDRETIKDQLEETYSKKKTVRHTDKINGVMPFITLAIFVVLGVLFDAWHPGWMVFLLVPVTAISLDIVNSGKTGKVFLLIPAMSLFAYLILGLFYSLWHPGWLILTLGVMVPILMTKELTLLQKLTAISPFIALNAFILIGYFTGTYSPTWTVFLLVVAIGLLNEKRVSHRFLLEGLLLISIALYFVAGILLENWALALFSFLVFIIPAIFTGHIHIKIHGFSTWIEKTTLIVSTILFFLWGYLFDAWAVSWVVFLAVPSMSVILHAKGRDSLVPITVFLSVVVFYLIGHYTGQWNLAWLAFLSIPVVAIAQEA